MRDILQWPLSLEVLYKQRPSWAPARKGLEINKETTHESHGHDGTPRARVEVDLVVHFFVVHFGRDARERELSQSR